MNQEMAELWKRSVVASLPRVKDEWLRAKRLDGDSTMSHMDTLEFAATVYWSDPSLSDALICQGLGITRDDLRAALDWCWAEVRCARCFAVLHVGLVSREGLEPSDAPPHRRPRIICDGCLQEFRRLIGQQAEVNRLSDTAEQTRIAELRSLPYHIYLQTPHWRETRQRAVDADSGACRICGSQDDLNVHHRTYERLGDEAPSDLVTLCQPCHQLFHENGKLARPSNNGDSSTR